jgi:uncharacterized protein (TIGR02118 family)
MMIKVMVLIRRRPDLSREQFRAYYEDQHVPLIDRLLPFYRVYRRHYLGEALRPGQIDGDFDVITELGFASAADFDAWRAALADSHILEQIRADESHFLVSDATRLWIVTDCASEYASS